MIKILQYSFYDLVRSRWSYVYFMFYLVLGFALLFLNSSVSKSVITLMNIIIVLTPMIGTIFGVMYFYSSREFTELLLAQPIKRSTIFLGQYLGVALSLTLSLVLGLGIPFMIYGIAQSTEIWNFGLLLLSGSFLTFIFVAVAANISLKHENKIKGFGYAIFIWLFMAVIYDGLFLISLIVFEDYPLDKFSLLATMFNLIETRYFSAFGIYGRCISKILRNQYRYVCLNRSTTSLVWYTCLLNEKNFGKKRFLEK